MPSWSPPSTATCPTMGKTRYENRYAARSALRAIGGRAKHKSRGLSAFHCRFCGGWHLGHRENKQGEPPKPSRTPATRLN